ncbi:arsenate reductase family protein [Tessaracoccus palaemonis]|uniref:Arsenate reductase n=1 Tax=Tessaracoccus palaemonis TaxID=2829499 RepID=A0ABX8SJ71_9ACTN|nr:ArsC/Spx/MgsR family protein [Tessaracoccus palaemonis]QXT63432.1 arsenate reductase [Tessaracoccus palaemonis]
MSVDVTILHNPRCSTSRAALETLEASGRSFEVVPYLKQPLTADQLRDLVALFPDSPTDLVRRDATFARLGLADEDVRTADQVVEVLTEHPALLQRPILIRHNADADRAIIGRPKQVVPEFLRP